MFTQQQTKHIRLHQRKRSLIIGIIKRVRRPYRIWTLKVNKEMWDFKGSLIIFQVWCMIKCFINWINSISYYIFGIKVPNISLYILYHMLLMKINIMLVNHMLYSVTKEIINDSDYYYILHIMYIV